MNGAKWTAKIIQFFILAKLLTKKIIFAKSDFTIILKTAENEPIMALLTTSFFVNNSPFFLTISTIKTAKLPSLPYTKKAVIWSRLLSLISPTQFLVSTPAASFLLPYDVPRTHSIWRDEDNKTNTFFAISLCYLCLHKLCGAKLQQIFDIYKIFDTFSKIIVRAERDKT